MACFTMLCFACSSEANPGSGAPQGGAGAGASGSAGVTSSAGAGGAAMAGAPGTTAMTGGGGGTAGAAADGGAGNGGTAGASANGGSGGGGTAGAAADGGAGNGGTAGASANGGSGGGGTAGASAGSGAGDGEHKSAGCGRMRTLEDGVQMVQSGGVQRSYRLRVPADYDQDRPYRLILGFHGATDSSDNVAPSYFGLWELSEGTTIFAAPDATGGIWKPDIDTPMVSDLIAQLSEELCIDTSRIVIEGFSHGGAMTWTLACALPGVFRVAVVHSGGGLPMPSSCEPIPFLSALGDDGSGQDMSSDYFARVNGCTVEDLPMPPSGGHACTNYSDCDDGYPTRWCDYDGGHTSAHVDSGENESWVPQEVWDFVTQF